MYYKNLDKSGTFFADWAVMAVHSENFCNFAINHITFEGVFSYLHGQNKQNCVHTIIHMLRFDEPQAS